LFYHRNVSFRPADWVTGIRAALTTVLAAMLIPSAAPDAATVVIIASVAAALDGVDGWIARRTRTASAFGARFDMETDAFLILVLCALVWTSGKAGAWVLASGLMRYAFVAAAVVWPWLQEPLESSRRRQTICVVQVVALIVALLPSLGSTAASAVTAAALAALAWSFLVDILWLWRLRDSRPLFSSSTRH
jgi:phosphatidylglycerophosphate synthase